MCRNIAEHESHERPLLQIVINSFRVGIHNVVGKSRFDHSVCLLSGGLPSSKLQAHMRSQMEQVGRGDWLTDGPTKWFSLSGIGNRQLAFLEP